MIKQNILSFILSISWWYGKAESTCISNEMICNNHGTCENGKCFCYYFWQGNECQIQWKDVHEGWLGYFFFMTYFSIATMSIVTVYSLYLIISFENSARKTGTSRWNITFFVTLLILLGALLRIIYYTIDPQGIFQIFSPAENGILYSLPIIIWIAAFDLVMLCWIELTQLSGIKRLKSLTKLKPVYIVLVILTFVTVLPIAIWESTEATNLSIDLYDALLFLYVFIVVVLSLTYGIKLMNIIKEIWKSTRNQGMKEFLNKITSFLLWCTAFEILTMLSLVLYSLVGADQNPFSFVTFYLIFRIEEFGITSSMLVSVKLKTF